MRPTRQIPDETHRDSEPSGVLNLHGHDPDEPLDENLHHGRSWHRYRYCHRNSEPLRVLDAGCGTGRSTIAAARLNPAATVLGVDTSDAALAIARASADAAGLSGLVFATHDLAAPLPDAWGQFDFVICRNVLGHAANPAGILTQLARQLDPRGLLLATFPSRAGRQSPRALRQAVDALASGDAGLEERTRIGMEVVQALRPDHPIVGYVTQARASTHVTTLHDLESDAFAATKELARVVLDALIDQREWTLDEALAQLEQAGLRPLYAATPWRWQPDRAFGPGPVPDSLPGRIYRIDPRQLSRLVDALDPSALNDEYALYACPADHQPEVPSWPRTRHADGASFDRLIPHLTGLARPDKALPTASASHGRTLYRTVAGAIGELDRIAVLRLAAVDGQSSCGDIDRNLAPHTRASDDPSLRQDCWVNLADSGLIMLESPGRGAS